jgi:hypothetical protein
MGPVDRVHGAGSQVHEPSLNVSRSILDLQLGLDSGEPLRTV